MTYDICPVVELLVLENLYIHAFTHRNLDVSKIGLLHIDLENQKERLSHIKTHFTCKELMYLSTCNRVEFTFVTEKEISTKELLLALYPELSSEDCDLLSSQVELFSSKKAVRHALSVASSIESMIVGEREIITQVRTAFENSKAYGLTGDFIRLLTKKVIETAKKVYTETNIAKKPVSVVSLAYHKLKSLNISLDSRILIVGAGQTNTRMCKFLKKHGFSNFTVFNRSFVNGNKLAMELEGQSHKLSELKDFNGGFDVLLTCTSAEQSIIDLPLYTKLLQGDTDKKTLIDIAIPQDIDSAVIEEHNVRYVSIDYLQKVSDENQKVRGKEVLEVKEIVKSALISFVKLMEERSVEIAMKDVPAQIKQIRKSAVTEVFKHDIENLDPETREVLDKVLGYVEKKYISGPMKLAKEIILKNASD